MKSLDWISYLKLEPHPEGGYFRELYRNKNTINIKELDKRYSDKRNLAASILYMLENSQVSKLHRLKSDEIWYFHYGSALRVHIFNEGKYLTEVLGTNYMKGEVLQLIVPAGTVFGVDIIGGEGFSIVGCMVTPGFHFNDFEMVSYENMKKLYPQHKDIIRKLT